MKKNILFLLYTCLISISFSQIKVSGRVLDQVSGKPVAYANVELEGTTEGTITNNDGSFYIESNSDSKRLITSFLGYKTAYLILDKNVMYDVVVVLEEEAQLLSTTVIGGKREKLKKKENPAYKILRKIWSKKKSIGVKSSNQYSYEKYQKLQFDINNVDSSFMNKKLFRGVEFMFEYVDTSSVSGKPFLPVFIDETVQKVYGNNRNKTVKTDLIAAQTSGMDNSQVTSQQLSHVFLDFNIYDNEINIISRAFISPLSRNGFATYDYRLMDSIEQDGYYNYNILFFPKNKQDLAFKGSMWVDGKSYSLSEIEMDVSRGINLNFLRDLVIQQSYKSINDSVFVIENEFVQMDFSLLDKKQEKLGVFVKKTTSFKDYEFDMELPDEFFKTVQDPYDTTPYERSVDFWSNKRHNKLKKEEKGVYEMLDRLKSTPKFKKVFNVASVLFTGYKAIGNTGWDIGSIYDMLGRNDVEGWRIRLGIQSYKSFNDLMRLKSYVAYGTEDQKWKYGLNYNWLVGKEDRWVLHAHYFHDIRQLGVNLTDVSALAFESFANAAVISRGENNRLNWVDEGSLGLSVEPKKNVTFNFNLTHRSISSASTEFVHQFTTDEGKVVDSFKDTKIEAGVVWTPKRQMTGIGVERISGSASPYPTILLNFTKGLTALGGEYNYHKLQFMYQQPLSLGRLGTFIPTVEAGKTWNDVPLPMLDVIPGNQSFYYVPSTFQMMNYYDFVTDQYFIAHAEHYFNGLILSRIPLIKKLKWRSFVRGSFGIGKLNDSNISRNSTNFVLNDLEKPYYEYGVGIENIGIGNLRIFQIYGGWRGNYLDNPGTERFGIKMGMNLKF